MTELSGTLEGVGLPAIIRFLTGLQKTGCLRIVHDDWQGEIVFESGQLRGASLGSRHGLSALDGLVEALPGGSFTFDTGARPGSAPSIDLSPEALQTHLDTLVARLVGGTPSLPSVDSVPELVAQDDSGEGEDPMPLDRGMLKTLLAVDGQRTVREIVAHRGSFDALWQLGSLAEVGLVRVVPTGAAPVARPVAPMVIESPTVPVAPQAEPEEAIAHCPKLGFEDDPGNSFGRPTRLHRCFAAATPLALSLDQQRELCLSDQFGTCPRLTVVGRGATRPPVGSSVNRSTAIGVTGNATTARVVAGNTAPAISAGGRTEVLPAQPEAEDPRIVRLPLGRAQPRLTACRYG